MAMEATPGSAMVTDMVMAMVATATVTAATAGLATPTMDMAVTTSVTLRQSQAMEVMAMGATPGATPGSALGRDTDMDMVVTAMVTTPTAGQATPTMDMAVTTSVTLRQSQAMEVMAMGATPGDTPGLALGRDTDMDIVVTAMVTTPTAGPATPTMDMEVTTSVMPMLSLAMADMVMEATPGSAMVT